MALIIETGTGVIGANSYVTVEEIKAFSEQRGIDLPASTQEIEIMAVLAFDFIESFRDKFKGRPTKPQQRTSWPRSCVEIACGEFMPDNDIPWQLKEAQCQATGEALDTDLMPNPQQAIVREKIDVIEVSYAEAKADDSIPPSFPKILAKLSPLFKSGGFRVRVVRG